MNVPGRIGGLRFLRTAVLVEMAMIGVLAVLVALAFVFNADRVDQINAERAANVLRSCREVNQRHDNTIRALDQLLAQRLKVATTEAERDELRESRTNTVLLISALVPRRDCAALVRQQITN